MNTDVWYFLFFHRLKAYFDAMYIFLRHIVKELYPGIKKTQIERNNSHP